MRIAPRLRGRFSKKTLVVGIVIAVVITLLVAFVVVNAQSGEKKIEQRIERLYAIEDPQFLRAMGVLLGPPIAGRQPRPACSSTATEIFPAMLAAIRGAQRDDHLRDLHLLVGRRSASEFADALAERARAGVQGARAARLGRHAEDGRRAARRDGARPASRSSSYHPLHWYHLARLNNRTHRKLLVVDGRVGFTGGVGIADKWTGDAQDPEHWRDTHYRVEGPVVAQMQAVVHRQLDQDHGRGAARRRLLPGARAGRRARAAQMFSSSPERRQREHAADVPAVDHRGAARRSTSSSAYFVPDELARRDAGRRAEARRERAASSCPGRAHRHRDRARAPRARAGATLLEAGVEIHEYQPTMYHCKVMIVDEFLVSVGSTNFDDRSFRLNDEANLNIYDAAFAAEQVAIFERRPGEVAPHHARRMAGAAAEGKAGRAPGVAARVAALAPPPTPGRRTAAALRRGGTIAADAMEWSHSWETTHRRRRGRRWRRTSGRPRRP